MNELHIPMKNYLMEKIASPRAKTGSSKAIKIPDLKDIRIKTMEMLTGPSSFASPKSDVVWNKGVCMLSPLAATTINQVYQDSLNTDTLPDSKGDQNNLSNRGDIILKPSKSSIAYKKKTISKMNKTKTENLLFTTAPSIVNIYSKILTIGANHNKVNA